MRQPGRSTALVLIYGLLVLARAPALAAGRGVAPAGAVDLCAAEQREGGWCEARGVGYVAGVEIASPLLFEALDAHGHPIHGPSLTCETCRRAQADGGYCAEHRMGFVNGLAYLSPLTYQLARAELVDPATVQCPVCRANMQGIGWCAEHQVGMVGERRVHDPADFARLVQAYELLLAAVARSAECEKCAAAMIADGYCADHRLHYAGGQVTTP